MRAINHALTGSIIGLVVGEPLIAVPAAVASHFICDAIPHFDNLPAKPSLKAKKKWISTPLFRRLIYADALLCFVLVLVLAIRTPNNWLLAAICAFAAAAPDLLSINLFNKSVRQEGWKPGAYMKFAGAIQWFQRPIGAVVEVAWFVAAIILIAPLLR